MAINSAFKCLNWRLQLLRVSWWRDHFFYIIFIKYQTRKWQSWWKETTIAYRYLLKLVLCPLADGHTICISCRLPYLQIGTWQWIATTLPHSSTYRIFSLSTRYLTIILHLVRKKREWARSSNHLILIKCRYIRYKVWDSLI